MEVSKYMKLKKFLILFIYLIFNVAILNCKLEPLKANTIDNAEVIHKGIKLDYNTRKASVFKKTIVKKKISKS